MPAKQENRILAIATALGGDELLLKAVSVEEPLGRLFQFEAELASEDAEVDFDKVMGENATIRLELPEGGTRYFNGVVSRFVQMANKGGYARYHATIVPWFWLLTRTADCRIFQEKTVPDIIEQVFRDLGFNDYQLNLSETYSPREYCVQYRETDFNFVSRLMEQEGIYYFFNHEDGKHTMVLADAASAHSPCPGYEEVEFVPLEEGAEGQQGITDWRVEREVQPGSCSLNDFDFKVPKKALISVSTKTRGHSAAEYQVYDYPGDFITASDGERLAKVRLEEYQAQHEICIGEATSRGLVTGGTFKLKLHPRDDQNREYLVTGVSLQADAGEFGTEGSAGGEDFFSCSVRTICSEESFRSVQSTAKPLIRGPQTAMVTGPSGEEIHVDEHGRVKVQFHWDRGSKADENSSCWIRVAQNWAGKKWGAIFSPRIGQEVIVEFLEGDPDRPIITGRVYNGEAKTPYELPAEKTKSTLKSNSSKGGAGFNEIRFEDKKDGEQLFLHAQKDMDVRVKNDYKQIVGGGEDGSKKEGSLHLIVKKDHFEKIEGDRHQVVVGDQLSSNDGDVNRTVKGDHLTKIDGGDHLTVGGDQSIKITGDASLKTAANLNTEAGQKISIKAGMDLHEKAGMNYGMDAGMAIHLKAGMTIVIEGGLQISLKAGPSFVDIGPAGVSISGPMVMINSGGAAGSGGGSSPTAPAAPEAPDPPKEAKEADSAKAGEIDKAPEAPKPPDPAQYSSAAKVLKSAAKDGTPFCEECARAAAEEEEVGEELITISSIAWLDGTDDLEVAAPTQWVNLPREAKYVDAANNVANIDRLGRKVRYKVSFSKPGSHSFKVKALPGDDNVVYTDAEKSRNSNFKFQDQEKSYTTGGDGTKIIEADFFTASAGGDTFKLVAEDTNNSPPVETGELTVKRIVYVVPIKMKDMTTAASLATTVAEFEKHGITLVLLPAVEIDRLANIGPAEENGYKNKCKTGFDGSLGKGKMPYAVAIGFTEHLAVKNPSQALELPDVEVGPGKAAAEIPVMARGLRDGDGLKTRRLWKDLVPGESWFVSATFTPDGGGAARNLAEAACAALPVGSSSCGTVKVDVTGLAAGKGTIKVTVNVVDRMRGGLSFSGGNLVCICTKAWWTDSNAGKQNTTAIHELGHKVGMVADGTGKLPDKVATYYAAKGHVGPHCYFDLGELDTYVGVSGNKCVMFGAVADGSPDEFCENCKPAVRKLDLGTGWTAS